MTGGPHVWKIGGSSALHLDVVDSMLSQPGVVADAIVFSAPGADEHSPGRMTQMLREYGRAPTAERMADIQAKFQYVAEPLGLAAVDALVDRTPADIKAWQRAGKPLEAFGEYRSTQMASLALGLEFVDGGDVIRFNRRGKLDERATERAIRNRIKPGTRCGITGYYGADPDGTIHLLPVGGSDTTQAYVSKALGAAVNHNSSDVDGYLTGPPKEVAGTRLIDKILYGEVRELSLGGNGLLQNEVGRILAGTGIPTYMHNTFGQSSEPGTVIADDRNYHWHPLVGVTGIHEMVGMSVAEAGMQESIGGTSRLFNLLKREGVPYDEIMSGTDYVTVYLKQEFEPDARRVGDILQDRHSGLEITLQPTSLIHIVGAGLRSNQRRLQAVEDIARAYREANVEMVGMVGVGPKRPAFSTMISRDATTGRAGDFQRALQAAHDALLAS